MLHLQNNPSVNGIQPTGPQAWRTLAAATARQRMRLTRKCGAKRSPGPALRKRPHAVPPAHGRNRKHLQGDLWEVRTQLANRIARVIFAVEGKTMYLPWLYQNNAQNCAR